ncbi:MAG: hypothetical protein K2N75_06210 [Helicobacter sp.]|uniref:formyltransferase family protein n=1 Tax=Helicobacter sp. TaxID=218 RepID=UPI0023CE2390|nr:formyltransferase family protein [Helicobacter sp.]MDE7175619.1 hypothetical protein [Helicobacter sp.]
MVYALPFLPKEERVVLFAHRPKQSEAVSAQEIAAKWNLSYQECQSDDEIPNECDIYLITGCGIVSKECLKGKKILNAHPGIIPNSRGLDSFKWAILEDRPLGVTLHYIDEKIDCGEIVSVSPTPIYPSDTLQTLARRHYENEIAMLSDFESRLAKPNNPFVGILQTQSTKRMKPIEEKEMMNHFETYKQKWQHNG